MRTTSFEQAFEVRPRPEGGFHVQLDGFGGTTLGCATLAVARDLPELALHALHACFLRPVPTEVPARLEISELSRGRRFARRRVEIREDGGRTCLDLVASFATPQEGPEVSDRAALELPQPESLPSQREVAEAEGWEETDESPWPIEMRWCGRPWDLEGPAEHSRYHAWVRPTAPPESEAGRVAGIAFTSDYHSHWPVARKLGGPFDAMGFTSLDQSVWIHRDLPWDDWWLLTSWTDQAHAGRSLGHRTLRTRDGRLVASMAQEAMIPGARLRD